MTRARIYLFKRGHACKQIEKKKKERFFLCLLAFYVRVTEENLSDFFDLRGKIRLSLWLLPILLNCFDASFTLYVFSSRASASFYSPSLLYAHSNKQYNNIQSSSLPCYFLFRRKRHNIYRNIYNATLCRPRCCLHITDLRYMFVTWKSEKCVGVNDLNAFNTNSHHELCYLEEIYYLELNVL